MPKPLRYCNSWFRWGISDLSELSEAQGKELVARAKVAMAEVREQIKREKVRDAARVKEREAKT